MVRKVRASVPKATRHKPEPVAVRNVAHPGIWQTALRLAGGDSKRITVENYSRVSVVLQQA